MKQDLVRERGRGGEGEWARGKEEGGEWARGKGRGAGEKKSREEKDTETSEKRTRERGTRTKERERERERERGGGRGGGLRKLVWAWPSHPRRGPRELTVRPAWVLRSKFNPSPAYQSSQFPFDVPFDLTTPPARGLWPPKSNGEISTCPIRLASRMGHSQHVPYDLSKKGEPTSRQLAPTSRQLVPTVFFSA